MFWKGTDLAGVSKPAAGQGRDTRRIAEFLHDGRLDSSFVPPPEIRELRMLTRLRVSWLEQRNEVHNQIRDRSEERRVGKECA